jgi:hypothetical protein
LLKQGIQILHCSLYIQITAKNQGGINSIEFKTAPGSRNIFYAAADKPAAIVIKVFYAFT